MPKSLRFGRNLEVNSFRVSFSLLTPAVKLSDELGFIGIRKCELYSANPLSNCGINKTGKSGEQIAKDAVNNRCQQKEKRRQHGAAVAS